METPAEEPGEVLGVEHEVETIAATGDDSNILFWLILMLAAGAGIGGVLLVSEKRSRL